MNNDLWKGSNILTNPKVLILGESHYDDNNIGEKVSFSTSGVVKYYLEAKEKRERWFQFFDKIVSSFGYDKNNAKLFFEKVFFGNYIDVVCGVGDNNASHYADLYRDTYNTEWFDFINQNEIDIVVCFSKLAYSHFPDLDDTSSHEKADQYNVGIIGGKSNIVDYCTYSHDTEHPHCSVKLIKALKVFGIRHPSSTGGFNSDQIYKFISKQDELSQFCYKEKQV